METATENPALKFLEHTTQTLARIPYTVKNVVVPFTRKADELSSALDASKVEWNSGGHGFKFDFITGKRVSNKDSPLNQVFEAIITDSAMPAVIQYHDFKDLVQGVVNGGALAMKAGTIAPLVAYNRTCEILERITGLPMPAHKETDSLETSFDNLAGSMYNMLTQIGAATISMDIDEAKMRISGYANNGNTR